jgi:hypothetical protein
METSSQQISHLLQRWSDGDGEALDQLMPPRNSCVFRPDKAGSSNFDTSAA